MPADSSIYRFRPLGLDIHPSHFQQAVHAEAELETASTTDSLCLPCGEESGYKMVTSYDCNCGPNEQREDEDDYFQGKWGGGVSDEVIEAAASAMGQTDTTSLGASDSSLLTDAVKNAKLLYSNCHTNGSTIREPAGTFACESEPRSSYTWQRRSRAL